MTMTLYASYSYFTSTVPPDLDGNLISDAGETANSLEFENKSDSIIITDNRDLNLKNYKFFGIKLYFY